MPDYTNRDLSLRVDRWTYNGGATKYISAVIGGAKNLWSRYDDFCTRLGIEMDLYHLAETDPKTLRYVHRRIQDGSFLPENPFEEKYISVFRELWPELRNDC